MPTGVYERKPSAKRTAHMRKICIDAVRISSENRREGITDSIISELAETGLTNAEISRKTGVTRWTVRHALKRTGLSSCARALREENLAVARSSGRCTWNTIKFNNGSVIKCQGTWELAFAKWSRDNGIELIRPRCLKYVTKSGRATHYIPDFFCEETGEYIEIKSDFLLSRQLDKYEAIRECNPDSLIRILSGSELALLGIFLWPFGPGRFPNKFLVDKPRIRLY